jgi:hypothetical protein
MYKITLLLLFIVGLSAMGCQKNKSITQKKFILSPFTDSLFAVFRNKHSGGQSFMIFVDKKDEDTHQITMMGTDNRALFALKKTTLFSFYINDTIPVGLYCGIEDFVIPNTEDTDTFKNINPYKRFKDNRIYSMAYVHTMDSVYTVEWEDELIPPFSLFVLRPTIFFKVPK